MIGHRGLSSRSRESKFNCPLPGPPGYGLCDLISHANYHAEPAFKSIGSDETIPNPRTNSIKRFDENIAPVDIVLSDEELVTIRKLVDSATGDAITSRSLNIAKLTNIPR